MISKINVKNVLQFLISFLLQPDICTVDKRILDLNPWPPRYRCDALPTELWRHQEWEFIPVTWREWDVYMIEICIWYRYVHTADIEYKWKWSSQRKARKKKNILRLQRECLAQYQQSILVNSESGINTEKPNCMTQSFNCISYRYELSTDPHKLL